MIYPNGFVSLWKLKKMINSGEFDVYIESIVDVPEDYDFIKNGIPRGVQHKLKDEKELIEHLTDIYTGKVNLCYDINDEYYRRHPHAGEHGGYTKPVFNWQYSGKANYEIRECKTNHQQDTTLEVCKYEGDFFDTCYVIAYWTKDDEGYEFKSVGHRFFEVDADDFGILWEGICFADKFLKDKWNKEG